MEQLQDSRQAGALSQCEIDLAAILASSELGSATGETVSLRDYLASVETFFEALGLAYPPQRVVRF